MVDGVIQHSGFCSDGGGCHGLFTVGVRNEVVWKQKKSMAAFVVQSARITLDQYKLAQSRK